MRETTNYGLKITDGNDNWKNIFDDNADNMETIDEALAAKLETVPDMGGATALTPGTAGLAPAPSAGETNRFLRADGTWTVPAGSGDSEVGIYTIDATIPVSSWQGSGPYTVTISDSSIIATMQVLEWSIVNETESTPLMLGPTEPTISAGRLTISTTVKPVASWTVHFDLGTDGSNVLAEVAGKAGQELLGYKEEGNTASRTIAIGKFVVWKGNMYKAKVAIPQGTAFSTSNLTAVGDGGFNELQTKIGDVGSTDLQTQVSSLNSKIGNHYDGIKYGGETYINFLRSGNIVYMSCTAGLWNSNGSNQIVLNGYSSGAVVPTGFRPTFNAEIREALNGKRITVDVNGNINTNEAISSMALRFGGCWITSDAMPS